MREGAESDGSGGEGRSRGEAGMCSQWRAEKPKARWEAAQAQNNEERNMEKGKPVLVAVATDEVRVRYQHHGLRVVLLHLWRADDAVSHIENERRNAGRCHPVLVVDLDWGGAPAAGGQAREDRGTRSHDARPRDPWRWETGADRLIRLPIYRQILPSLRPLWSEGGGAGEELKGPLWSGCRRGAALA